MFSNHSRNIHDVLKGEVFERRRASKGAGKKETYPRTNSLPTIFTLNSVFDNRLTSAPSIIKCSNEIKCKSNT